MRFVETSENENSDVNLMTRRLLLRRMMAGASLAMAAGVPALAQGRQGAAAAPAAAQPVPAPDATTEKFVSLMRELSNWNRWGPNDEMGAVNLITPAKRKQAAALVREGAAFSMAGDAQMKTAVDLPQPIVLNVSHPGGGQAPNPFKTGGNADSQLIVYHNFVQTHMNALSHFTYDGKLYNGYSVDEVTMEDGAKKDNILAFKSGIFTRGVLMDMARYKGTDWLKPSEAIYPADLDGWEKKTGVKVQPGDMLMVRTGRWGRRAKLGPWPLSEGIAGLHMDCAKWIHERDVAVIGSDGDADVRPSLVTGIGAPIHELCLCAMGMPMFDEMNLELIGQEAAQRKRWEFLITAAPMRIPGATGSLINPIAIF